MTTDAMMASWVRSSARRVETVEGVVDDLGEQISALPSAGDLSDPTEVEVYIQFAESLLSDRAAAAEAVAAARRAHADAVRIATGTSVSEDEASVLAFAVRARGADAVVAWSSPPAAVSVRPQASCATRNRPRGSTRRPRRRVVRSSARSGDSGDDGPGEPAAAMAALLLGVLVVAALCRGRAR